MSEHEQKHEVKIFIDQQSHRSPNPTTGVALYALGKIEPGLELFREVTGDREDPEVPNGPETVRLKEDEHFHSGKPKTYTIYLNGQEKKIATKTVTYEEIVKLAFTTPITGQNIIYTVGYEDGPHKNPSGSLMTGGKVYVKDGMIFDVTPTDKS
jgi:Multiubiquitin